MPADMVQYFKIMASPTTRTATTTCTAPISGTTILKSLTNYQEQIGNKTQTLMVYLQDFIGQYNSYLQGANTQISNANQTLTSLARGQ